MKLGPVTKLDKENKTTSKKCEVDIMSIICDVIVTFGIFGQFGAVWRPDSGGQTLLQLVSKCLEDHLLHNKFIDNSIQKVCMEKIPG